MRECFSAARLVRLGRRTVFTLGGEQFEHQESDADDDETVGEVEVGPRIAAPQPEVEEVDDFPAEDPIDQVPDGAAENEPERERRETMKRDDMNLSPISTGEQT